MDSKRFHWYYDLMHRSIMAGIDIPLYCVNRCCGEFHSQPRPYMSYWSTPEYCFEKYAKGKERYPVCVRSAVMHNLKLLPDLTKEKKPIINLPLFGSKSNIQLKKTWFTQKKNSNAFGRRMMSVQA